MQMKENMSSSSQLQKVMWNHNFMAIYSTSELHHENVLTGQMRDTRSPVVAISLSGSNRSLSWTMDKIQNKYYDV